MIIFRRIMGVQIFLIDFYQGDAAVSTLDRFNKCYVTSTVSVSLKWQSGRRYVSDTASKL